MDINLIDLLYPLTAQIPTVLGMILLILVALIIAGIVRKITIKGLNKANIGGLLRKWHIVTEDSQVPGIIKSIGQLAYFLVILFFMPVILAGLNLGDAVAPITNMFNKFFAFIPNLIAAGLILFVGAFFCKFIKSLVVGALVAKLVANLLENILQTSGLDNYSKFLSFNGQATHKLSAVIAQVIRAILLIFFFVQALQVLNLEVLNTIGTSFIAYLPSLISSGLILTFAIIGGNILSSFINDVTNSKLIADIVRYGVLVLATFMALDQLKFAQNIVQSSFTLILGAAAVAFSLAFGLGGRDWAVKQLEKLNKDK